jgi:cytochrome bd-type quinol oxidase subunit 2
VGVGVPKFVFGCCGAILLLLRLEKRALQSHTRRIASQIAFVALAVVMAFDSLMAPEVSAMEVPATAEMSMMEVPATAMST